MVRMKRGLVALVAATVLSAGVANAATVFNDDFSYPDGPLVGQNGWLQTGTVATNPIQVSGGQAVVGTSGQDVYAPLSSPVPHTDGQAIDTSVTINLSAAQTSGDYFLHLSDPAGTTGNFYQRLFAKSDGSGGFLLGLLGAAGTGSSTTYGTTSLSFNTDYDVDIRWNFVASDTKNDTFELSVDSTPYLTHTWNSTTVNEPPDVSAVNLRQGSATASPSVKVDNLVIESVPEPASLGLLAFAAMGLMRRKR